MAVERNGWKIYLHPLFADRFNALRKQARELEKQLPEADLDKHPAVKLYAALAEIVYEQVPANPDHKQFRLGGSLGDAHTNWRRVKRHGLPDRHRLFFRFDSGHRVIVFCWLNDEKTLRKEGARTDVYESFRKMLDNGNPPADLDALLKALEVEGETRTAVTGKAGVAAAPKPAVRKPEKEASRAEKGQPASSRKPKGPASKAKGRPAR